MALEDYDPTGFFGSPNQFLSPAMGQMLATNPEALIPHFAANGIGPPQTQVAENLAGRFNAINDTTTPPDIVPPSGALPAPSPYTPPQSAGGPDVVGPHFGAGDVQQRASDYYGSLVPQWLKKGFQNAVQYGSGANVPPTKTPDRIAPSTAGPVPQTALNQPQNVSTGDVNLPDVPAAPTAPPALASTVGPQAGTPEAAAAAAAAPAKSTPMSPELKKMIDAISGVRPPPAPPTPVLHPEVGKAAAPMAGSPIASMLAEILSGKGVSSNTLRLLQAVGK